MLHNQPSIETGALPALTRALATRHPEIRVESRLIPLADPRAYDLLYRHMRAAAEQAQAACGAAAEYHVLLSPGTPQMHATWVLLTQTVFQATQWQASDRPGLAAAERVHIPFDIQAELIDPALSDAGRRSVPPALPDLIAEAPAMRRVLETALRVAPTDATVMLLGETGVGKSLLADLIHRHSLRRGQPFVTIDCSALPPTLMEAELFGVMKGAFTGADRNKPGLFESAQGGTVFLDEIAELEPALQVKLLRALQERSIRRIGTVEEVPINVRVLAATHQPIEHLLATGRFREDLYYRLAVVPLRLPPLRQLLEAYSWPGNIRQLANLIAGTATVAEGKFISPELVLEHHPALDQHAPGTNGSSSMTLHQALEECERRVITEALKLHKTQKKAALALGLRSQQALQRRIVRLRRTQGSQTRPRAP